MSHLETRFTDFNKERLHSLLKEKKRRLGLEDLHFFCKEILHYKDLTDKSGFHGEYCAHLENPDQHFKLTLTPRGTLKTSIGTVGQPLQEICKNPNLRGLIASKKFTNATKIMEELIGHVEDNDEFKDLYGDLKAGSKKWNASEIIVGTRTIRKKEPTLMCAGIDVTMTGMHYDRIWVDDPHDEQNTGNQDQIDKVVSWYRQLFSLLDPGGYIYIKGTIWHYNDLYNFIINQERLRKQTGLSKRFDIFLRDAFHGTNDDLMKGRVKDSDCLWPERLSPEFLRDQLVEQGPYTFSCQYRLNPIDDDTATFKRSWFKTCDYSEIPRRLNIYSTCDPMRDEKGSDYLAITTCGLDDKWNFYILDCVRVKADEHDTVEHLDRVNKNLRPLKIGFESVAWQKSYKKYVQLLAALKGVHLPIVELHTDTKITKRMRIRGLVPYVKAGLFIIPCKDGDLRNLSGSMATLLDELTRFPKVANDDTVDALAYMTQLTKAPGVLNILKKLNPKSFKAVREHNRHKDTKKHLGMYNKRKS